VNLYYLADISSVIDRSPVLPGGVTIRPVAEDDIPLMAGPYLRAFGPAAVTSVDDAVAELSASLGGAWGVPWPEASLAAWRDGELAGAVLAVRRPSWKDAPGYPWLIDVFTDPCHRRAGIARALIGAACRVMSTAGEPRVGLTVDDENRAALTLYKSLGFSKTS
jgi:ribosomal protein S18 acetylase RimI-like enzyme